MNPENEPLIESSFRRLLAAIENEREGLRASWKQLNEERESRRKESLQVAEETKKWCEAERQKVEAAWKEVEEIRSKVEILLAEDTEVFNLLVSGTEMDVPRHVLKALPKSHLSHMFTSEFINTIPRQEDRYVLDFHPECFQIIVNYLHALNLTNRSGSPEPAVPHVPNSLRVPMAVLVDALKLDPFVPPNSIYPNGTSLVVEDNSKLTATCQGWQVTSAIHSLNPALESCFTVQILRNPDPRGGLAIGVVGKPPIGALVHQLTQPSGVIYNSNNGIVVTPVVETNETHKGRPFKEGTTVSVKYTPKSRTVRWFVNGQSLGNCQVKNADEMEEIYPCFALFSPGQTIKVDFDIQN